MLGESERCRTATDGGRVVCYHRSRWEARDIARQMTRDAAEQELPESDEKTNTEGETKDPEEPDDLDDLNRLDEPPTA